jgi:hypothetical protein
LKLRLFFKHCIQNLKRKYRQALEEQTIWVQKAY